MTLAAPKTAEQSLVDTPLYTWWDAARYLRIPFWGVLALLGRLRGWREPEWLFHRFRRGFAYLPPLDDDLPLQDFPDGQPRICFREFADLFVRAAAIQCLAEWVRVPGLRPEDWERLHAAVWRMLEDNKQVALFPGDSAAEDRVELLLGAFKERLSEGEVALLRKWLSYRIARVDLSDGTPARVYPISRDPAENSPRIVVIDPRIRFGRPTIAGHGVPTDALFERHQAGDSVSELAEDYGLTSAEVEEAIRYEASPPALIAPFRVW